MSSNKTILLVEDNPSDADLTIRTTDYMLSDDVSLTRGTHQFAFGGTLEHSRTNSIDVGPGVGAYSFDGQATGLGLADFLAGKLARCRKANRTGITRGGTTFRCIARMSGS